MFLRKILTIFLLAFASNALSQVVDSSFSVKEIIIDGNRKTKSSIILRELTFKSGDTIQDWKYHSEQSRKQLINLFLFNEIQLERGGDTVFVHVTERWYFWPIPILDYADRNFNQWWLTKDPKRLIYGVDLSWYNLRGRNETMVLNLVMGYTRSAGLMYRMPFINKRKTWGAQLNMSMNANREVWYATKDDKVQFFSDKDRQLIRRKSAEITFTHRKKFFGYHHIYGGFQQIDVSDTVLSDEVNRVYLLDGKRSQLELYLGYQFVFDKRDFKGFPLSGHLLKLVAEGSSFPGANNGFQTLTFKASYSNYRPLGGDFFASMHGTLHWYSNAYPQYTHTQALGYGKDYIRGYELNVIDGSHFALGKAELKYRFMNKKYEFISKIRNYEKAQVAMFLSAYFDAGYVVNQWNLDGSYLSNRLPNTMQNGGGIGYNLVMFYDYCMRLEYSFNRQLNSRFYISFVAAM